MKNIFINISVKTKILASSAIGLILISLFLASYMYLAGRTQLQIAMKDKDQSLAQMVALGVGLGMKTGDFTVIKEALDYARHDSSLAFIVVYDNDLEILASHNPFDMDLSPQIVMSPAISQELNGWTVDKVMQSVVFKGEDFGILYYACTHEWIEKASMKLMANALKVSAIIFLIGILISWLLSRAITEPLSKLTEAARQVAGGERNSQLVTTGGDEIGVLADAFREMVGNVDTAINQLQQVNDQLQTSIQRMPLGYILTDEALNIIAWNRAAVTVFGHSEKDVIGRSLPELVASGEVVNQMAADYSNLLTEELQSPEYEYRNVHADQSEVICTWRNAVLKNRDGVTLGLLSMVLDITKRRQAEEQQQEMEQKLDRANRLESLGVLAGGVAHDLNNILGPLIGYPELLLESLPAESTERKHVKRIYESARQAADIVQDLLALARRGKYVMKPTSVNQVLEAFLETATFSKLTESNPNISVQLNLAENIPPIMGSDAHLSKTFMNLLVNAFEATVGDGVLMIESSTEIHDVSFGSREQIPPGNYVIVRIIDSGSGIASEDISKIFEPYYSKKPMGRSGSGLGLAVVYGVIKDHNGYIDIQSQVNAGTEFRLYFPGTDQLTSLPETTKVPLSGEERILIVDDTIEQREMAAVLLTSLGYSVATVAHGHEAIEVVTTTQFDLIVLDMIMEPGFDGLDTYEALIKIRPNLKAIIVSGYAPSDRVEKAQALGAGTYLRKPYTRTAIGETVRTELDRQVGRQPVHV